ncbi:MAG: hypothetical protein KC912_16305 [Proteobacteria bacterium]|nr:hypothetical protein [Pseudomonadota bacterium]
MDTARAQSPTNNLRMRPVYDWHSDGTPEEFIERLSQLISFDPAVNIQFGKRHAVLSIPIEARHTWSPTLDVQVRDSEGGTHVHALLGPEPTVWTFFLFMYAASAFPSLIGAIVGMVQYNIGQPAWGLAAIPAFVVLWGLIYGASFVGKGLGAEQIHQLLAVLEANLSVDARDLG